jgi:hypothetical protein
MTSVTGSAFVLATTLAAAATPEAERVGEGVVSVGCVVGSDRQATSPSEPARSSASRGAMRPECRRVV